MTLDKSMTRQEVENNLREYWRLNGLKSTGFWGMVGLQKALAYCFLQGPKETQILVEGAMRDAERRMRYLIIAA
jgi:hypothetical protein